MRFFNTNPTSCLAYLVVVILVTWPRAGQFLLSSEAFVRIRPDDESPALSSNVTKKGRGGCLKIKYQVKLSPW